MKYHTYPEDKDSGVKLYPNEWRVKKLCYLTKKIGDGLHATPQYVDNSEFYFINGNNLENGSIFTSN